MRRAVFLDRDGVLNRSAVRNGKPFAPRRFEEFRLLPGVRSAVGSLKSRGLLIIVVTNQPDIGNGLVDVRDVEAMHARLRQRIDPDEIIVCPHRQADGCECRKPKPGMLLAAASRWGIDLARSFMIGDRSGDIVAGQRAGCYTIFIQRGYHEPLCSKPHAILLSLPQAARHVLTKI